MYLEQLFSSEPRSGGSSAQRRQRGYSHLRLRTPISHRYIRVLLSSYIHGLVGRHLDDPCLWYTENAKTAGRQACSHARGWSEVQGENQQREISPRPARRRHDHPQQVCKEKGCMTLFPVQIVNSLLFLLPVTTWLGGVVVRALDS